MRSGDRLYAAELLNPGSPMTLKPRAGETHGYVSVRGPFEIVENPKVNQPNAAAPMDEDAICAYFEHDKLAEKYGDCLYYVVAGD